MVVLGFTAQHIPDSEYNLESVSTFPASALQLFTTLVKELSLGQPPRFQ